MLYHWTFALPAGQMAMVELAKQSTCHHTLSHVYKASEPFRARKTAANPVITGTSEVGLQLLISLTRHCCSMKYHCFVPSQARLAWLIRCGLSMWRQTVLDKFFEAIAAGHEAGQQLN